MATAFLIKRVICGSRRFDSTRGGRSRSLTRLPLGRGRATLAVVIYTIPVLLGLPLPAGKLLSLSIIAGDPFWGPRFFAFIHNSFTLVGDAALILICLAIFLSYARRQLGDMAISGAKQAASMGYAMPGAAIAVDDLTPLEVFDNTVDSFMRAQFGISTGLLPSGTIVALLFAYVVRYLAVAVKTVDTAFQRIPPSMDDAARNLGEGPSGVLMRVHVPLLR